MFSRLTIRTRLIATMAILGLLIAVTGTVGIYGVHSVNAALEETYSNQMASAQAIANAKAQLMRARLAQDRAVFHPESPEVPALLKRAMAVFVPLIVFLTVSIVGDRLQLVDTTVVERFRAGAEPVYRIAPGQHAVAAYYLLGEAVTPLRFDDSLYRMLGENLVALTRERELLLSTSTYDERSISSARLPGALLGSLRFTL